MFVQKVAPPGSRVESWTVLGDDDAPVAAVESYLSYLSDIERSPNTVKAYAHHHHHHHQTGGDRHSHHPHGIVHNTQSITRNELHQLAGLHRERAPTTPIPSSEHRPTPGLVGKLVGEQIERRGTTRDPTARETCSDLHRWEWMSLVGIISHLL
jgi:hypothetical protein